MKTTGDGIKKGTVRQDRQDKEKKSNTEGTSKRIQRKRIELDLKKRNKKKRETKRKETERGGWEKIIDRDIGQAEDRGKERREEVNTNIK